MIRFFRQIRQRLITDNKFSKYLLYAIGEILLVVIGILIALQVDSWNEERKDQIRLRNMLQSIVEELNQDLLYVNKSKEDLVNQNKSIKSFLDHPDYTGFTRDSLEQSLQTWAMLNTFRRTGFIRLRDSGISEYGKYEEVVEEIFYYYEFVHTFILEKEDDHLKMVDKSDEYWRFIQTTYEFDWSLGLHSIQSDETAISTLNTLLKSPVPRNILKINYRQNQFLINIYEPIGEYIPELIQKIEGVIGEDL